jgi:hypothetical protein
MTANQMRERGWMNQDSKGYYRFKRERSYSKQKSTAYKEQE